MRAILLPVLIISIALVASATDVDQILPEVDFAEVEPVQELELIDTSDHTHASDHTHDHNEPDHSDPGDFDWHADSEEPAKKAEVIVGDAAHDEGAEGARAYSRAGTKMGIGTLVPDDSACPSHCAPNSICHGCESDHCSVTNVCGMEGVTTDLPNGVDCPSSCSLVGLPAACPACASQFCDKDEKCRHNPKGGPAGNPMLRHEAAAAKAAKVAEAARIAAHAKAMAEAAKRAAGSAKAMIHHEEAVSHNCQECVLGCEAFAKLGCHGALDEHTHAFPATGLCTFSSLERKCPECTQACSGGVEGVHPIVHHDGPLHVGKLPVATGSANN
jgi:hypothetical protein